MKYNTNLNDEIKLQNAIVKAKRLCKANKCGLIDLMIISMKVHASNKKSNIKEGKNNE